METTTKTLIKTALQADRSLSAPERARLLAAIRQGERPTPCVNRLLRRAEVARRLGGSLRLVDRLCAAGALTKRKLPGRVRASGILEHEVEALIAGHGGAI